MKNNLNLYGCKNVLSLNMDAIFFSKDLNKYNPTCIFIDSPWGNMWNKDLKKYNITIDNIKLENYVNDIIKSLNTTKNKNKFIILKLPKNYDIELLYNSTKHNNVFQYLYILKKMIIIIYEIIT